MLSFYQIYEVKKVISVAETNDIWWDHMYMIAFDSFYYI